MEMLTFNKWSSKV